MWNPTNRGNCIFCSKEIKIHTTSSNSVKVFLMYNFHILHVNTSTEEITFKSKAVNWASSDFHLPKMFGSPLKECESWIFLIMYICHAVQHTKNTVLGEDPQLHLPLGWNKNNILGITMLENTASAFTAWCLTTWLEICAGSLLLHLSFTNKRHLIDPRQLVWIINIRLKQIFCLCLKSLQRCASVENTSNLDISDQTKVWWSNSRFHNCCDTQTSR